VARKEARNAYRILQSKAILDMKMRQVDYIKADAVEICWKDRW
jgi:hypothetical protein